MSTRCSGLASRSFIIGSRLCPPAMMRASEPRRWSAAMAPSTLVARSYSNEAGVCKGSLLCLRVDLARRGAGVLQVRLLALGEVGPCVGGRVRLVPAGGVDPGVGGRFLGSRRLAQRLAAELGILGELLPGSVGAAELRRHDPLRGGLGPLSLLANLAVVGGGAAALLARRGHPPGRRCRSPATGGTPVGAAVGPRGRAIARPGSRPRRSAARSRSGSRRRWGPRGLAAPA